MAGGLRLHLSGHSPKSPLEKSHKIPSHTVGRQDTQVVNMKVPFLVGLPHIVGIYGVKPVLCHDGRGYVKVEPLEGVVHV